MPKAMFTTLIDKKIKQDFKKSVKDKGLLIQNEVEKLFLEYLKQGKNK